jgi:hypothetical protein
VTIGYKPFAHAHRRHDHLIDEQLRRASHVGAKHQRREAVATAIRNMLVIALADCLMVLHRHLSPEYRKSWLIEVIGDVYRLKHFGGSIDLHIP